MNSNVIALIEGAKRVSRGMSKVAAARPDDHPLQSNAETFRGAADMLTALSAEIVRVEASNEQLRARLRRIAALQVRNASETIAAGDWKTLVDELQTIAQDAIMPGSIPPKPRNVPRR